MGSLALLARELGHTVTGSDQNVYPPMSTLLKDQGIEILTGYDADQLDPAPDLIIVGNAMTRGIPVVEAMLDRHLPFTSGPAWLGQALSADTRVIAVAGTHGKTTTSSMIAWILDHAGYEPGFLIGGVPSGFSVSSRIGAGAWFVIEADEYDTAFFDKRSKFVHYRPDVLVLNNLEFDHADIFENLAAIQKQVHHVVRIVPQAGLVIANAADQNIHDTLEMGCWTPIETFNGNTRPAVTDIPPRLRLVNVSDDYTRLTVAEGDDQHDINWQLAGQHNVENALAALTACRATGLSLKAACAGLASFKPTRRRLELRAESDETRLYDDFAHHPTAIRLTLDAVKSRHHGARIIALLEPRSNTMKMGVHRDTLAESLADADLALVLLDEGLDWTLDQTGHISTFSGVDALEQAVQKLIEPGDQIVIMSNGAFGGITQRLADWLNAS